MELIKLEETASTNTYASAHASELAPWSVVITDCQTGGRGQRGNSWESEEGKNLTLSMIIKPEGFRARDQFAISEAVALAVVDLLYDNGIDARVKWPNDIYVGDRKIAGILIEHSVLGMDISHSVAGIGLNVNQTEFLSDAPNPVSMAGLKGREFDRATLVKELGERLEHYCGLAFEPVGRDYLHSFFKTLLWRGDGKFHTFKIPDGPRFEAKIAEVEEGGMLVLEERDGNRSKYAFKEIIFELDAKDEGQEEGNDNIAPPKGV